MKSLKKSNQAGSSETRDAIAELAVGKGVKFKTIKAFFDDLLDESAIDSQSAGYQRFVIKITQRLGKLLLFGDNSVCATIGLRSQAVNAPFSLRHVAIALHWHLIRNCE